MKIENAGERNIAEAEAEQAEQEIAGDIWEIPAVLYESPDGRNRFRMTEKEKVAFIEKIVSKVLRSFEEEKFILDEEKYLKYLLRLKAYADRPCMRAAKTPWDVLLIETETRLKRRLGGIV
jgi:hypothetical protein